MTASARQLDWLKPLPIRWEAGLFHVQRPPHNLTPVLPPIELTFEQVSNDVHHPRHRIKPRKPEIRRALSCSLRYNHHPKYAGGQPLLPDDPRFHPFRRTIGPLLAHNLWQSHRIIAAPFLCYLPRRPIAGFIDAIVQHPEGDVAVVTLHTCHRQDHLVSAARTELGGLIAALADHQICWVNHGITLWAGPGGTEIEHHHPDICLGHWADAVDLFSFSSKLKTKAPSAHVAARTHAPAGASGIQ